MEIKNTRVSAIFCFLVGIKATVGILVEKPQNTVAMVDENAIIKCKSNKGRGLLRWNLGNDVLWNGYSIIPHTCPCHCCHVDADTSGNYNLNITAVKETARLYECIEPGSDQPESSSLTVVKSKLNNKCEVISNGTTLSCSIEFYGEWVPTIKWSRSDGNQVDHANSSAYNEKVTSTLTTQLKLCKVNDASTSSSDMTSKTKTPAGVKFTAYVYFNETNRPAKVTAMNIPTVPADVAEWTSPPLCIAASEDINNSASYGTQIGCGVGIPGGGALLAGGGVVAFKKLKSRPTDSSPKERGQDTGKTLDLEKQTKQIMMI